MPLPREALLGALLAAATGCERGQPLAVRPEPSAASLLRPGPAPAPSGPRSACRDPSPLLVGGSDTGYERCADGSLHRREARECPWRLPAPPRRPPGSYPPHPCRVGHDDDCDNRGVCEPGYGAAPWCNPGCVRDADCGTGQLCLCREPVGQCVPASCTTDASCPAGRCAETFDRCGGPSFACQTPDDTCGGDADCGGPEGATKRCVKGDDGRWACGNLACPRGRPLLVAGRERHADLRHAAWG